MSVCYIVSQRLNHSHLKPLTCLNARRFRHPRRMGKVPGQWRQKRCPEAESSIEGRLELELHICVEVKFVQTADTGTTINQYISIYILYIYIHIICIDIDWTFFGYHIM